MTFSGMGETVTPSIHVVLSTIHQTPQPDADDLELRLCHYGGNEDTAIELVDLHVK